jgi:hypothetical protein
MKTLILISTSLLVVISTFSQTSEKRWSIGLHGGLIQYNGDIGNDFYDIDAPTYGTGAISVSRFIVSHLDLNLLITKGIAGTVHDESYFQRNLTTAMINCRFNILGPKSFILPYLFVGTGTAIFDKNDDAEDVRIDFIAPSFGGGLNINLSPSVMLNLQETFLYLGSDNRDGISKNENDMFLLHAIGLSFNFGDRQY